MLKQRGNFQKFQILFQDSVKRFRLELKKIATFKSSMLFSTSLNARVEINFVINLAVGQVISNV